MKPSGKVTVITRTKDRPFFLKRAMLSVLGQSYDNWMHVIVNDGGDPATVDALVAFHADLYAGRVAVLHHAESQGMQTASNSGLAAVDSEYVVIHDDDDSWEPDFLKVTTACLDAEGVDSPVRGVVTQTTQVLEELTVSGEIEQIDTLPYYPFSHVGLKTMQKRNLFPPIAFLYRKAVHDTVGLFRQEFDVLGDHDFSLRLLRHFEIAVVPTFNANYHWRHGSEGNTVTRARNIHRTMLNRMQNAYYRQLLDDPENAVGDLFKIEMPPPDSPPAVAFKKREENPPRSLPMPDFLEEFDFDVLSLDVFDTVLQRRCNFPKDVFKLLEDRAAKELGLRGVPVAIARREAETKARRIIRNEIRIEEIYEVLAEILQLTREQAGNLMALELELEGQMLYTNPSWLALHDACRSKGIRIVFVSDMYLSSEVIGRLLEKNGFSQPEVYVSCEYGCSKHEGGLHKSVSTKLGIPPDRILHIGDNHWSDFIRSLQAGWQAFHWSPEFICIPWVDQVEPHYFAVDDLLSTRIFGEVRRLGGEFKSISGNMMAKLGLEVAGPLYLSFMLWVLQQAKRDGIRKLILLGRDGYYWEKTCSLLEGSLHHDVEIEFLDSSRKVLNFASFDGLDEEAIEFLSTPNPALSVRDFVSRTGLDPDTFLDQIAQAGFDDPELIITTPMGGKFLRPVYEQRLHDLFQLLKPGLEEQFARDRSGVDRVLTEAGFDPSDCAVVDIGWNASCAQALSRMFRLREPNTLKGYFFGTWEKAFQGTYPVCLKSFFVHAGQPFQNAELIRESVNFIESLNAAPYPALVAFKEVDGTPQPQFSDQLKGGFTPAQQEDLWAGAKHFLNGMLDYLPHDPGNRPGHNYLQLVLRRILREPSPDEVEQLGGILHSEGFGIVSYTPLIQNIDEETYGDELMCAYWASNWKRGFLSALPEDKCRFVMENARPGAKRTVSELKEDLAWRQKQVDAFWNEKEGYKKEIQSLREEIDQLTVANNRLKTDLDWKSGEAHALLKEKELLRKDLDVLRRSIPQPEGS